MMNSLLLGFYKGEAMIDTLKYTHQLEEASFTKKQAEATVRILCDVLEKDLATKKDIREIQQKLNEAEITLSHKIERLGLHLTIKLGTMFAAGLALITTILKVL